ncbi:hypothetical protein [Halobacillus litoralis]|uniref:hypothetical protein n=1 Tax=Halobacillus litoralis TaxID=45668 RepID=UPI001CFEE266|nr:hypothetical protein [Halobacillus litoralis]
MKKMFLSLSLLLLLPIVAACGEETKEGKAAEVKGEEQKEKTGSDIHEEDISGTVEAQEEEVVREFAFNIGDESEEIVLEEHQLNEELGKRIFIPEGFEVTYNENGAFTAAGKDEWIEFMVSMVAYDRRYTNEPMKEKELFEVYITSNLAGDEQVLNEFNLKENALDEKYDYVVSGDYFDQRMYSGLRMHDGKRYHVNIEFWNKKFHKNDELALGILRNIEFN